MSEVNLLSRSLSATGNTFFALVFLQFQLHKTLEIPSGNSELSKKLNLQNFLEDMKAQDCRAAYSKLKSIRLFRI